MEINIPKLKEYAASCRVLYVEDDAVIREQTTAFLSRFFPNIAVAENGGQGLQHYQDGSFDIVITDINMPVMNGIEMIEKIRALNPDQIILVTSAYNDSDNLMSLINLGVVRFVLKPFDNKQFIIMLYQVVEALHFKKAHRQMQRQAVEAQKMIDMVDNGIVLIKEGKVATANRAFLSIIGFEDFETMQIEMPEIGVLFQTAEHCLDAQTNLELIKQLRSTPEEDHKVYIESGGSLNEYQVNYTQVDDREDYVLVFTDITAVQEALNRDEHTKLPVRKALLDRIESMKMTLNTVPVMLVSVKNFNNVMQWYGKADAIAIEQEASQCLQNILNRVARKAFLGYFGQNQFVILLNHNSPSPIKDRLNETAFTHNSKIKDSHLRTDIDFHLSLETSEIALEGSKNRELLEIDLINAFDAMNL